MGGRVFGRNDNGDGMGRVGISTKNYDEMVINGEYLNFPTWIENLNVDTGVSVALTENNQPVTEFTKRGNYSFTINYDIIEDNLERYKEKLKQIEDLVFSNTDLPIVCDKLNRRGIHSIICLSYSPEDTKTDGTGSIECQEYRHYDYQNAGNQNSLQDIYNTEVSESTQQDTDTTVNNEQ